MAESRRNTESINQHRNRHFPFEFVSLLSFSFSIASLYDDDDDDILFSPLVVASYEKKWNEATRTADPNRTCPVCFTPLTPVCLTCSPLQARYVMYIDFEPPLVTKD
jgi:hypothetical protein